MNNFVKEFYKRNGVDPEDIAYLEADGSGYKVRILSHRHYYTGCLRNLGSA